MIPHDTHLQIGSLLFEGLDQIDLTGPFEVLSRIPNSTYRIYGKTAEPVRDLKGLRLTPDAALADAPQLDVLHVPGGFGQEALMEDARGARAGSRGRRPARAASSRCAPAPCSAARPACFRGRRATTHWASFHLLPLFGAIPVNERVVVDGNWVFAAGVTAGIDGALRLAAELRGDDAARAIQLYMVVRAGAAVRQRHARDRARRDPRAGPAIGRRHHRAARGDRAARRRPARHRASRHGGRMIAASRQSPQRKENDMTTVTFTKTAPPPWLLAMWKEIDDKTFGKGFDCFAEDADLQSRRRRLARPRDHPQQSARTSSTRDLPRCTTSSNTGTARC